MKVVTKISHILTVLVRGEVAEEFDEQYVHVV